MNEAILKNISDSLQGLAFGTVTIKVNHSRMVQIEVKENKRFDDVWVSECGDILFPEPDSWIHMTPF